jgi:hypothetical protein
MQITSLIVIMDFFVHWMLADYHWILMIFARFRQLKVVKQYQKYCIRFLKTILIFHQPFLLTMILSRIDIPGTISLIGFDNVGLAELMDPQLTTIDTPKYELGCTAVNVLAETMKTCNAGNRVSKMTALKPSIVIRSSTRKIN